ncbi:MFS transporter [Caulobacter segnis]|uniref:MFS transporter n=1 Tax=Caulobacter segnis TaxID=88688 RepID=UPI00240EB7B1|nr:MFS transporter [Caulobacter segnis]MDG2522908.1 MFS transporter [Caulobacter segnis]
MTLPTETLGSVPAAEPLSAATRRKAITACLLGNLFELFDFGVYGYFAVQIGRAIFPSTDPVVSILASFATYGVGFLMRPVGAMVLGSYGDRHGRKAALALTITLMAVATGLTGLVPSYGAIGVWAPILLVIFRLLQGFSTGGEWGGATTFLVEHAPPGRRGFYGSLQQVSTGLAQILAISSALLLNSVLSPEDLQAWGWRLPFLVGFILAPIGYYLRSRVEESPEYLAAAREKRIPAAPLRVALTTHREAVLVCFGLTMIWTVASYVFITFLPTFAAQSLGMAPTLALTGTICASLANLAIVPLSGLALDRWGGRWPLIASASGFALFSIPLFMLLAQAQSLPALATVAIVAGALYGLYNGAAPTVLCTLFPTTVRYTALSVGYNGAVMIFGGFAPFISTFLVRQTGAAIAPSFYVTACAVATLAVLLWSRRRGAFIH